MSNESFGSRVALFVEKHNEENAGIDYYIAESVVFGVGNVREIALRFEMVHFSTTYK